MHKILMINTGGTFNKVYNSHNGLVEVDKSSDTLEDIASHWLCEFTIHNILGKDSLEINNQDRECILKTIQESAYKHIIIIHGTDTIDITADYLSQAMLDKTIVLTGAMIPYSIDPIEATANLASAYGYLQAENNNGIYISMNGIIDTYKTVAKDRRKGKFIYT